MGGYSLVKLENYKGGEGELQKTLVDSGAHAVIVRSDKVNNTVLEGVSLPNLKLIVRAGAGVDTIDLKACTEKELVVMNTPGQNSNAVAELAFGMMVGAVRNWYDGSSGTELKGKCLALHGFGQVARNMLRLAKGFEMNVKAYDPFLTPEQIEGAGGVKAVSSVADLFDKADFVSLHIPCTPETKSSIGLALLKSMNKGGVLVNTARADVIDEEGLVTALKEERTDLKYVADVQPISDAFNEFAKAQDRKRVFCTPKKMGAQTSEANNNAGVAAANQIVAYFEEGDVRCQVNKPGQTF